SCVRPGVCEVRASPLRPVSALIRLDLPTLERPAKAISMPHIGGSAASDPAAAVNCQSPANSLRPRSISSGVKANRETGGRAFMKRAPHGEEPLTPASLFFLKKLLSFSQRRATPPPYRFTLSNSSILAPCRRMITDCWITDSVLFQAQ